MMAFSPDLGVGIGVFSNADNATGWLTSRTVVQFFQYLVDHPQAASWATTRQRMYPQHVAAQLHDQRERQAQVRAQPLWQAWAWHPDAAARAAYAGRFRGERLPVEAVVASEADLLRLRIGALDRALQPAAVDLFGAQAGPLDVAEPLRFLRDANGQLSGFEFDGERYLRIAAGPG